jgi:hypothetical protein
VGGVSLFSQFPVNKPAKLRISYLLIKKQVFYLVSKNTGEVHTGHCRLFSSPLRRGL